MVLILIPTAFKAFQKETIFLCAPARTFHYLTSLRQWRSSLKTSRFSTRPSASILYRKTPVFPTPFPFESSFITNTKPTYHKGKSVLYLLGDLDSNQDTRLQRAMSYH